MGKKKGKKKGKGPPVVVTEFDNLPLLELETTTVPGKREELKLVSNTRNHEQLERDTLMRFYEITSAEATRLEGLKAARAQVETARVQAETARVQVETAQAAPIETPGLSLRSRGKRILVLEGGGQKAYAMYALLRKLESLLGLSTPIAQFYDLVCGTSAGGASACVHAIELPPPLLCPIPCLLLCSLSGCSPIECQTTGSRSHRPRHGRRAWR